MHPAFPPYRIGEERAVDTSVAHKLADAPAIAFRHVSLSFDEKPALVDVSFELQRRQMICVTGLASSGKSVLLRLAIGILRPDAGQIEIEGQRVDGLNENELLAIRGHSMGLAFQEDTLFTSLSVYDNAAYRLDEQGWPEDETDRAVTEILRFVGLENDAEKLPEELSIGMRRRLEIARALIGWPPIMLYDEPASGLDPINAKRILDLIIRARDLHEISSLYVTKELHEITYLASHYASEDEAGRVAIGQGVRGQAPETKVLLLDAGQVAFFGGVAEYKASKQPAVTRMTDVKLPAPKVERQISDPWRRTRTTSRSLV